MILEYNTEAAFVKALTGKLKQTLIMKYTRVESHSTGNGIPDLFVQGNGTDLWIECKNTKTKSPAAKMKVEWRPGQQAWYHDYAITHWHKKQVVTLNSFRDGVAIIRNDKIYTGNIVACADFWFISWEEWTKMSIDTFIVVLIMASHNIDLRDCKTLRQMTNTWMDHYFSGIDYDPEVLWADVAGDWLDNEIAKPDLKEFFYQKQLYLIRQLGLL